MQGEDCKGARAEAEAPTGIGVGQLAALARVGALEVEEVGRKKNCHEPTLWSPPRHELQGQDCLAGLHVPSPVHDSMRVG